MTAKLCAAVLFVALAAAEVGCALGYVTYFHPEVKGASEVGHPDPYMRPPPPSAAELSAGSISIGCTNIRKFMLLPIPWLRRGFRPGELHVELGFSAQPNQVRVDLGSVGATIEGVSRRPTRIEYEGRRPAPRYVETIVLPIGGRARLDTPVRLIFTFDTDLSGIDDFVVSLGELDVDGKRILLPPLAFAREGDFVVYRSPEKKKGAAEDEADGSEAF